jgi:hypothetical protein
MKVNVKADGTVELDVSNGEGQAALDLIHALQADARASARLVEEVAATRQAESAGLSQLLYRTWEYLVENDRPDGVHVSAVARAFGINDSAASERMQALLKAGNAKRSRRGYYRAICDGKD